MNELNVLVKSSRGVIEFQNYDEIKHQIKVELEKYKGLTLTDENKNDVKKLKQDLNGVIKLMSDERIAIKKDFNRPLDEFETKVKEISEIIKTTVSELEKQINAQRNGTERRQEIRTRKLLR